MIIFLEEFYRQIIWSWAVVLLKQWLNFSVRHPHVPNIFLLQLYCRNRELSPHSIPIHTHVLLSPLHRQRFTWWVDSPNAVDRAIANASRSSKVPNILTSLGVDFGAVTIFMFLYSRESNAKNAQLARLSREESLSNLKIRVDENMIVSVEEKKRKRSITAILSIYQWSIKKGNFLISLIDQRAIIRSSAR